MAKSFEKLAARKLRHTGKSIKNIAETLNVSKSTVSLWCRDIRLSSEQVERLIENQIRSGYKGRMIGAAMNRKKREDAIAFYRRQGRIQTKHIANKQLLMLGLGLYMGEGRQDGNRFQFSNSNPAIITIILVWIQKILLVKPENIRCRVYINRMHASRVTRVERSWSEITSIPRNQFKRTVLINVRAKKMYENHDTYLGTLALWVTKSSTLQYKTLGLIEGLVYNMKIRMPA